MAQVLKEEVRNRIYSAAIEEFYENNYNSAKMKDIAQRAGVPTGLIYSYFKNKKDLFSAIVKPVFQKIKDFMDHEENIKDADEARIFGMFEEIELDFIMKIFKKRKQVLILIDKSGGTKFEDAQEKLVNLLGEHMKDHLSDRIKNVEVNQEDFFYHILADNFMERIFEIFRHFEDFEEAKDMIDVIAKQHFYGVRYFVD